jgi:hypothetical protein
VASLRIKREMRDRVCETEAARYFRRWFPAEVGFHICSEICEGSAVLWASDAEHKLGFPDASERITSASIAIL